MKVRPHLPACNQGPDNIMHVLFQCTKAVEVWKLLGIYDIVKKACQVDRSGEVALEHLMCLPDPDVHILCLRNLRETIATTAWYLWFERRKLTHGDRTKNAAQIQLAVRGLAANFVIARKPKAKARSATWTRPRAGYMKLNVDGGFHNDLLEGTVGAVLQDHKGKFVAAANERLNFCYDQFSAEAIAVKFGLNLAKMMGCSEIEVMLVKEICPRGNNKVIIYFLIS